jgi:hypothetical protein
MGRQRAPAVSPDQPVRVHATILAAENLLPGDGPAMASALAALANHLIDIPDPVEWQRESRADRPVQGRTE